MPPSTIEHLDPDIAKLEQDQPAEIPAVSIDPVRLKPQRPVCRDARKFGISDHREAAVLFPLGLAPCVVIDDDPVTVVAIGCDPFGMVGPV